MVTLLNLGFLEATLAPVTAIEDLAVSSFLHRILGSHHRPVAHAFSLALALGISSCPALAFALARRVMAAEMT